MSNTSPIVYLNGEFLPLENARIPVMDRGFLFGDGVYEMVAVYGNRVFRLEEHLARLQNSLDAIEIPNPFDNSEWEQIIDSVLARNQVSNHRSIYIEVTRGVGDRDHFYDSRLKPTVFVLCRPVVPGDYSAGVAAITHPDIRWEYCHIKSISLLPGVLLKNRANRENGAHEAILIRNGEVTEGAASNVFIVRDGNIRTPQKDNRLLSGITRDLLIELLQDSGFTVGETGVNEKELRSADEIWITSSVMEIAPVIKLDGNPVGEGKPGPVWRQARDLYDSFRQEMPEHGASRGG